MITQVPKYLHINQNTDLFITLNGLEFLELSSTRSLPVGKPMWEATL